jgi:hypothetical protein
LVANGKAMLDKTSLKIIAQVNFDREPQSAKFILTTPVYLPCPVDFSGLPA